jgi:FHA domain
VVRPGSSRRRIARTLNAAYGDGLLSEDTFCQRIDQLLDARLIDPWRLIGDLNLRTSRDDWRRRIRGAVAAALAAIRTVPSVRQPMLLALDWTGHQGELLIGRHHDCDVVLLDPAVSRRHARLFFRDGTWVLQDLVSTNGTIVNGDRVGRCELRPGDHLVLGDQCLKID